LEESIAGEEVRGRATNGWDGFSVSLDTDDDGLSCPEEHDRRRCSIPEWVKAKA
jgi:hypothetical protein